MSNKKYISKSNVWWLAIVLVALGLSSVIIYDQFKKRNQFANTQASSMPINISAMQYAKAYRDNSVAADAYYKGRLLNVTGVVSRIGRDANNNIYVAMQINLGDDIYCFVKDENYVLQLHPGSSLSFIGIGGGNSIVGPLVYDQQLKNNDFATP